MLPEAGFAVVGTAVAGDSVSGASRSEAALAGAAGSCAAGLDASGLGAAESGAAESDAAGVDAVRSGAAAFGASVPADDVRAAWLDALADMESSAVQSGDGEYAPDAWDSAAVTAAADLGPLPVDLQERALDLAVTQKSAIARVVEARRTVMAHLAALRSVPAVRDAEQSVYLDVNG